MFFEKETGQPATGPERRSMRRFEIRLPALVKLTGNGFQELLTETHNVSARGIFFYIDRPIASGSRLEITLTLPSQITLAEAVRVRFTARVLRTETTQGSSRTGVAAAIEDHEFLRSVAAQEFAGSVSGSMAKAQTKDYDAREPVQDPTRYPMSARSRSSMGSTTKARCLGKGRLPTTRFGRMF